MTEQQPEQPTLDPAPPVSEEPAVGATTTGGGPSSSATDPSSAKASSTSSPSTRYAAYDVDRLRFVGGVHDTKTDARKAGKLLAKNVEVREVEA